MPSIPVIKKYSLFLLSVFIFSICEGQDKATLRGFVRDAEKKQPLIGALIIQSGNQTNGAVAGQDEALNVRR